MTVVLLLQGPRAFIDEQNIIKFIVWNLKLLQYYLLVSVISGELLIFALRFD